MACGRVKKSPAENLPVSGAKVQVVFVLRHGCSAWGRERSSSAQHWRSSYLIRGIQEKSSWCGLRRGERPRNQALWLLLLVLGGFRGRCTNIAPWISRSFLVGYLLQCGFVGLVRRFPFFDFFSAQRLFRVYRNAQIRLRECRPGEHAGHRYHYDEGSQHRTSCSPFVLHLAAEKLSATRTLVYAAATPQAPDAAPSRAGAAWPR